MIVIYYHVEPLKHYMEATKKFVFGTLAKHYKIIDGVTKVRSADMGAILKEHWCEDDILIIGQDNIPTLFRIKEMERCNYLACVNPCISYPVGTGLDRPVLNQMGKYNMNYEINETPQWIFYGGTGVSKISKRLQYRTNIKDVIGFPRFDSDLHRIFHNYDVDFNWHAHYPLSEHTKKSIKAIQCN